MGVYMKISKMVRQSKILKKVYFVVFYNKIANRIRYRKLRDVKIIGGDQSTDQNFVIIRRSGGVDFGIFSDIIFFYHIY
jgi:hypothetical protein